MMSVVKIENFESSRLLRARLSKNEKNKLNPRIWKKRNFILHLRKLKKRTTNVK